MADIPLPGPRPRVIRPEGKPGGSASPLADSFRSGFWGQLTQAVSRETAQWEEADSDFNALAHVPKGYEAYAQAFHGAGNQHEIDVIKSSIDDNIALRQRREQRSFGKNLWTDLLAGVADPVNLVGGTAVGAGLTKGLLLGARDLGTAGALEAGATSELDPTGSHQEALVSAGTAFGLGTVIGGVAGKLGRDLPRYSAPAGDLIGQIRALEGGGTIDRPKTSPKGAKGPMQVMDATARDPGLPGVRPWDGKTEADRVRFGEDYALALDKKYGGDRAKVLAAYNGGFGRVDKKVAKYGVNWLAHMPEETQAYVAKALGAEALAEVRANPAGVLDQVEGVALPDHVDGIPVLESRGEDGPLAVYVPGKSGDQVLGEVALEEAKGSLQRDRVGGGVDEDPLAGIERVPLKDVPNVVKAEHRKANTIPGYAEALGVASVGGRVDIEDVRQLVEITRKQRQIAEMQARQDAGKIDWHPADRLEPVDMPLDRDRLTMRVRILRERVDRLRGKAQSMVKAQLAQLEDELRAAGGESTPDVQVAGSEFGSQLATEGDLYVANRARQSAQPDEELRRLREADSLKRARDLDSGELADELPFGLEDGIAPGGLDGPHFVINRRRILDLFASKPWTEAKDGVIPFEADAFQTPAEWLDFVIAHEREHSLNPRRADEDAAAYENRVNDEAYKAIMAKRADLALERSWVLVGTPLHRAYSLVKDTGARLHESLYRLAADMSVQTAAGRAGRVLSPDGSVFQRVDRWRAKSAEIGAELRKHYMDEMGLSDGGRRLNEVRAGVVSLVNRFGGKKTFEQFKTEVIAHHVGFTEEWKGVDYSNPSDAVKAAAAVLAKIDAQVEKEASELDVFGRHTKEKLAAADKLEKAGMVAEAEAMRKEASQPMSKMGGQHYYRMYDQTALLADREGAVARLQGAYVRLGFSEEEAALAAVRAYEHLTLDPDGTSDVMRRVAQGSKKVEIPWTDAEAFPYIIRDPEASYGIYLRQMGGQIEMTRTFGDPHALDELDAMRADLEERGVAPDKAEEALLLFEDARDHILGQFHRRDALGWDYRTARVLKNLAQMAVLGKGIYSQVNDVAKFIGVQGLGLKRLMTGEGPAGLIGGLAAAAKGDLSKFHPGGIAKQAGEALELSNARVVSLMMDSDAAVYAQRDTKFERLLARMNVPYFILNLMTPWTVALKEMAGLVAAHNIIDDAKRVAQAIHEGAEAPQDALERLGLAGFSRQDAQLLAAMPTEKGTTGLHLPNVLAWEGEDGAAMRTRLLSAVNGEIKRSVVTQGVLDRPRILDGVFYSKAGREQALAEVEAREGDVTAARAALKGLDPTSAEYQDALDALKDASAAYNQARAQVGQRSRNYQPLLSLPFQLHSFALASGSKLLHGLFTSAERNRVGGILSLMLTGMYITWLKNFDPVGAVTGNAERKKKKQDQWDKMTWGAFIAHSFEYSNLGAIFTDVVKNADVASQQLTGGVIPGWGAPDDPTNPGQRQHHWSETIGATAGVAPGLIAGLVEPFVTQDDFSAKVAAVKRVVPYANMMWWAGAVDRLQALASGAAARGPAPSSFAPSPATGSRGVPSFIGGDHALPDPREPLLTEVLASSAHVPVEPLNPRAPLPPKKGRTRARRPVHGVLGLPA